MRQKNGQSEQATQVLEKLIEEYPGEADLTAVNLLAELHMANGAFATTISWIDRARTLYCADQGLPLDLSVKAGICHAYMGNLVVAEVHHLIVIYFCDYTQFFLLSLFIQCMTSVK